MKSNEARIEMGPERQSQNNLGIWKMNMSQEMKDGKKWQGQKIKTSQKTENWGQRFGTKQKGNFFEKKKAEKGV